VFEAFVRSGEAAKAAVQQAERLERQAAWLDSTIIEIIISEAQNEVADFRKLGFDIIPR
jgi:type I restriction enzyme R subunit